MKTSYYSESIQSEEERKGTMSQMNQRGELIVSQRVNSWEWKTNPYISHTGRKYRDFLRLNARQGRFSRVARCIEEIYGQELCEVIQSSNPVPRPNTRDKAGLWLQTRLEFNGQFFLEANSCLVVEESLTISQPPNSWEWITRPYISGTGRKYRDVFRLNNRGGYTKVARCIEEKFSEELYGAIQRANPIPRPNMQDKAGWWVQSRGEYDGRFVLEINSPVTEEIQFVLKNSFGHRYESLEEKSPAPKSALESRTVESDRALAPIPPADDRSATHCIKCGRDCSRCVCRRDIPSEEIVIEKNGIVSLKRNSDWHH